MREGKSDEGLALFARASDVRPAEADAWLYHARALVQMGRVQEASLLLERGRKLATDPTTLETAYHQLVATGSLR